MTTEWRTILRGPGIRRESGVLHAVTFDHHYGAGQNIAWVTTACGRKGRKGYDVVYYRPCKQCERAVGAKA